MTPARLRIHGRVVPDWRSLGGTSDVVDLASVEAAAEVLACSDMFFGPKNNLIMPGRAANMGDGWETKRRRGTDRACDWVLVRLAGAGEISRIEVDTNHFKGNYPDSCSIEACDAEGATQGELLGDTIAWRGLLPRTKLEAHTRHFFVEELARVGEVTHVRVNAFPDGGISRLRVHGTMARRGRLAHGLLSLNSLPRARATQALTTCCGSSSWVSKMLVTLPAQNADDLFAASESAASELSTDDWLEAFAHHPRIGESAAKRTQSVLAQAFSSEEQAGLRSASDDTVRALADANRAYDAKFGFIFIVCASGKTASEMLALVRSRYGNDRDNELRIAAAEQQKITRLRLERLLLK
jgi:allantoicase